MNPAEHGRRRVATLSSLLLLACTTLALANLPGDDLPPGWLAAFVLPGAALARLTHLTPWPWQRALLALALQTTACWLALVLVGPMSRPAALACTILPPLGFAAARHQEADQALALFLAFCVLLVGTILDGPDLPLLTAFVVCACLSLRCTSHLAVLAHADGARHGGAGPGARSAVSGTLPIVVGSLLAVFAVERTLDWLPSPLRSGRPAPVASGGAGSGIGNDRRVGLDDSFLLDGTRGVLSELAGEQLVRARAGDGGAVGAGLYLRSGFFTVPGLDRWQLGTLEPVPASAADRHVLHAPIATLPVQELELERFAGARNFVFVPPAACEVRGLLDVVVDPAREWIRQRKAQDTGPYLVAWQMVPPPAAGTPADPRGRGLGLLRLPRDLDTTRYQALLQDWNVPDDAVGAMERIATGLARRCRYDRIEPTGPFANAIDNFLFAPGDRRGYCMHFASAAALLLRLRGIPCRIGVGLFGGDPDRDEDGARMFGSHHAHAWVEVPFPGRGYVVFDPTPAAERGQRTPSRLDTSGDDAAPQAKANDTDVLAALLAWLQEPWVLAAAVLLALAASSWRRRLPAPADAAAAPVVRSARKLLARLLQALAAAGHARPRGCTLELFARQLAARASLPPAVAQAFHAYQEVRFGGHAFDAPREQALRQGIEAAAAMTPPEAARVQPTAGQS